MQPSRFMTDPLQTVQAHGVQANFEICNICWVWVPHRIRSTQVKRVDGVKI